MSMSRRFLKSYSVKAFMDQSFTNMNAHAHSCQVEVILFESYSVVLIFSDVMQDGLPVLVDLIFSV